MSREATFSFVPSNQIKSERDTDLICSLNTKTGLILFSPKSYQIDELKNKYVRFYVDVLKQTLAWKILKENELGELKDYRMIKSSFKDKENNKNETISVGIPRVCIDALKLKLPSYKKMVIKKYLSQGLLQVDEKFYYVTFK